MKKIRQSEVAKLSGVSPATVSRVLNNSGYVAEDVRARVEQAMAQLEYIPSKRTTPKRDPVIALILPHANLNPYFGKLEYCLHHECIRMGFGTVFAKADRITNETLVSTLKDLAGMSICGIVIATFTGNHLEDATRAALNAFGIPIVFIERTANCYGFNRVTVENRLGTSLATEHLVKSGHKKLLYITKTTHSEAEQARLNGFLSVVERQEGAVKGVVAQCTEHNPKAAYQATEEMFVRHPDITGIVAWNDMMALGAMLYVMQQGKRIPQDVAIIGHDDILAPTLNPPISSVHMPIEEVAAAAVEILSKNYHNSDLSNRTISLEPWLVVR